MYILSLLTASRVDGEPNPLEHSHGQISPHQVKLIGALSGDAYGTLSALLPALGKCWVHIICTLNWEDGSLDHGTFSMSATNRNVLFIFMVNLTAIAMYNVEIPCSMRLTKIPQRSHLLNHTQHQCVQYPMAALDLDTFRTVSDPHTKRRAHGYYK